ncbi:F-box domain-containing protein [Entamoeba marina]
MQSLNHPSSHIHSFDNWLSISTPDGVKAHYLISDFTIIDVTYQHSIQFNLLFNHFQTLSNLCGWYPFLHSIKYNKNDQCTSYLLNPTTSMFDIFEFTHTIIKQESNVTIILSGKPTIEFQLTESTFSILYKTKHHHSPQNLYSFCELLFNCLTSSLNGSQSSNDLLNLEHSTYPRYSSYSLPRCIHESQRLRLTTNNKGDQLLIQADIAVPMPMDQLQQLISKRVISLLQSIEVHQHLKTTVDASSLRFVKRNSKIFNALLFDSKIVEESPCYFLPSLFAFANEKPYETSSHTSSKTTRLRGNILIAIPCIHNISKQTKSKFLSNFIAPILYFFATLTTNNLPLPSFSFRAKSPEMRPIQSVSSLLFSAITLSKTSVPKTTLETLPLPILQHIIMFLPLPSYLQLHLISKNLHCLLSASHPTTTSILSTLHTSLCFYPHHPPLITTMSSLRKIATLHYHWRNTKITPTQHKVSVCAISNHLSYPTQPTPPAFFIGSTTGDIQLMSHTPTFSQFIQTPIISNKVNRIRHLLVGTYVAYDGGFISIHPPSKQPKTLQLNWIEERSNKIDFTFDGGCGFCWSNNFNTFSLENGEIISTFKGFDNTINDVTQWNNYFIGASGQQICLFDQRGKNENIIFTQSPNIIKTLSIVNQNEIVSCGGNQAILWDITAGKIRTECELQGPPLVVTSFNKKLVCAHENGDIVLLWTKHGLHDKRTLFQIDGTPVSIGMDNSALVVSNNLDTIFLADFSQFSDPFP